MKRLALLLTIGAVLLGGCDSYLEERLAFLELPFEYQGSFDGNFYNLGADLTWGVPDNGDDGGIYFAQSTTYLFYWRDDQTVLFDFLNDPWLRRIASVSSPGMFYTLEESGLNEDMFRLLTTDFSAWFTTSHGTLAIDPVSGTWRSTASGANLYLAELDPVPVIDVVATDISGTSFAAPTPVLDATGDITYTDILNQAYPGADSMWGPAAAVFHTFAPASLASYEGEHKFIISRSDGLTGRQRTVLVSVTQSAPHTFTTREIAATSDFHFVSRDRFVGMDGDTLKIFNADGDQLASHTLEGMRLLGYRSSTDRELVFLYTSDEDEGDRVWGIYSLPASFIEGAD